MAALKPEIEHFVTAITSAEATVRQPAHAKIGERGKQAAMAKKEQALQSGNRYEASASK
jgi:hypothetical protein